mmetsp:Transcript_86235/g.136109  ORF Transcript_86235/g.136109 Transcript_86235/m.136109 type:complete len:125 (+) Transcript_86235:52-426(+)
MLLRGLLIGYALCLTRAAKYLIGTEANSGAYEIVFDEDKKVLDLEQDCHASKACPPVIVMKGRQVGSIDVKNCQDGVMYTFVNHGDLDAGIVIQHEGGIYGAKGIPQHGVGSCFCYTDQALLCG